MMRVAFGKLAAGLVLALTSLATTAQAGDPSYLTISAGSWETLRDKYREPELDIAYRSSTQLWIFKPHAGVVVSKDGDFYGYGGFLVDVYFGPHVVLSPNTAVGVWGGGGFDLGSRVEFRSGADLAWRFDNASRLGVGFYHISNAGLTRRNPGDESLLMTYSYPLGRPTSTTAKAGPAVKPAVAQTYFAGSNTAR